jgi:hypothetical protein
MKCWHIENIIEDIESQKKDFVFLSLYGEVRQMISSKQKESIREQDTFDSYRWPYQVATFTNPSGADERHSSYGFM